ncbi:MAG: hypothetical protein IKF97_06560 [Clostridia bacterium]|nr:hypothetical protein [Clostridia bacterium]
MDIFTIDYIQEITAKYFSIDKDDLISSKRTKNIIFARQIAMYLCRELGHASFNEIGDKFGNRDHVIVIYACNIINKKIETNETIRLIADSLKNVISENIYQY